MDQTIDMEGDMPKMVIACCPWCGRPVYGGDSGEDQPFPEVQYVCYCRQEEDTLRPVEADFQHSDTMNVVPGDRKFVLVYRPC